MNNKPMRLCIVCGSAFLAILAATNMAFAYSLPSIFKQSVPPSKRAVHDLRPHLKAQVSGTDFNQNVLLSEADLWSAYNNVKKTIETLWIPLNGIGQEYQNTIISNLKEITKPGRFNPSDKQERLTVNQLLLWTYQQAINTIGVIGASKNLPDDRKKALIGEIAQTTNDYFKINFTSTKGFTEDFQKPTQAIIGLVNTEDGVWGFTFASVKNDQLNKCARKFAEKIVPAAIEKGGADRLTLLQFAAWANSTIDTGLKALQDSKDMEDTDKTKKVDAVAAKYCELPNAGTAMKDLEPKIQEVYALTQIVKAEPAPVVATSTEVTAPPVGPAPTPIPASEVKKPVEKQATKTTPAKKKIKPAKKAKAAAKK